MSIDPKNAGKVSIAISGALALLAGLVFLFVTLLGDYTWVARIGGALWIAGLTMIILMPTMTPLMRNRLERK